LNIVLDSLKGPEEVQHDSVVHKNLRVQALEPLGSGKRDQMEQKLAADAFVLILIRYGER